jgi:3-oxoacyl-[acyl-carrier-protein] synthase II
VSDRLWITGVGLLTPLGVGVEATWSALVRGDRAIGPIGLFDVSGQRVGIGAQVGDVPWPDAQDPWSRTSAMAWFAAREALASAGLHTNAARVGLVVGGTTGGMFETEQILARLHAESGRGDALRALLSHPLTATGDCIEHHLGPFERVRTVSSACSSGAVALVVAAAWLRAGEVDAVVAGGCDALCRLTLSGFNALGAVDPEPCRPFDRRRRGTSLGEGAGFLVIERRKSALARGATPLAELAGWACGAEAHHITNPDPDGSVISSLIDRALERANLSPADVDYVNAHGTGTPSNDSTEAAALARALGPELARIPVSSSKGQIGHTLGAAGAIEAAITTLVVSRRVLVPTGGLEEPDPALALQHVPARGREVPRVRAAISNAFGFGGMDAVLVFRDAHAPVEAGAGFGPRRAGDSLRRVVVTGAGVFGPPGQSAADGCAGLLDTRWTGSRAADPEVHLDAMRARRLDASARLAVVAVELALEDAAGGAAATEPPGSTGVVLGGGLGGVDASAAFMHRIFEKGPRAASPAEFPNLVPSGPVGHLSIYARLRGPAFCAVDLGATGEAAVVQSAQLIAAGEAGRLVAGASEVRSGLVEQALAAVLEPGARRDDVGVDVAAAVALEDEAGALARGARVLARVDCALEWRGDGARALAAIRGPRTAAAEVVVGRQDPALDAALAGSAWASCKRKTCSGALGDSPALGAVAVAVAAARVARGLVDEALVIGAAPSHGYAVLLVRA